MLIDWKVTASETVRYLSRSDLAQARDFPTRMKSLPLMFESLLINPKLDTISCGYDTGDYFALRRMNRFLIEQYGIPRSSIYALLSHDTRNPASGGKLIAYDAQGNVLAEKAWDNPRGYDHRTRPWYTDAMKTTELVRTAPHAYFLSVGPIQIIARRSLDFKSVVSVTLSGRVIDEAMRDYAPHPSAVMILFNDQGELLNDSRKPVRPRKNRAGVLGMPMLGETTDPVLLSLLQPLTAADLGKAVRKTIAGEDWFVYTSQLSEYSERHFYLAILMPEKYIISEAREHAEQGVYLTLLILVLSIPVSWYFARRITGPLTQLAAMVDKTRHFNFNSNTTVQSRIKELRELSNGFALARRTVCRFLDINAAVVAEKDFSRLLKIVLQETSDAVEAHAGAIYLLSANGAVLSPAASICHVNGIVAGTEDESSRKSACSYHVLDTISISEQEDNPIVKAMFSKHPLITEITKGEISNARLCPALGGTKRLQLIAMPLKNSEDQISGVLCLYRRGHLRLPDSAMLSFIERLAWGAAVAIEKQLLLHEQKKLMDSIIVLLAGAIDAKSPYTGGHCQRVPIITKMLAEEVDRVQSGPFADFHLDTEGWEALHVAAWLHDCGKVTTSEHVVDKATKLETVYNRIHELRTRFEVVKRDREIACLKAVLAGEDEEQARARLRDELRKLDDDFSFIAECNQGLKTLSDDEIKRLAAIAAQTWERTLSDRLGISLEEADRIRHVPEPTLPAKEKLLADKPEHKVLHDIAEPLPFRDSWGFTSQATEYKCNFGELYNLSIRSGTLTEEERYKVNDHITQTLIMLSRLPFPKHLRNVPEIAGSHHERMDGKGYPRGLYKKDMRVESRIVALSDVFEALTARDRPYKKKKNLSESLDIMAKMANNGQLDKDLFELFVNRGVYLRYATEHLLPEQIDNVDSSALIIATSSPL